MAEDSKTNSRDGVGLDIWLSGCMTVLQRAPVQFPALARWLTTVLNSAPGA